MSFTPDATTWNSSKTKEKLSPTAFLHYIIPAKSRGPCPRSTFCHPERLSRKNRGSSTPRGLSRFRTAECLCRRAISRRSHRPRSLSRRTLRSTAFFSSFPRNQAPGGGNSRARGRSAVSSPFSCAGISASPQKSACSDTTNGYATGFLYATMFGIQPAR